MKDFRSDLSDELSALAPPPLGDIVGAAASSGRRTRRIRAISAVVGSAVAMAGVAVLLGGPLSTVGGSAVPVSAAAGPLGSAVASPSASATGTPSAAAQPAEPQVPITGAALLSAVLPLLPPGATSHLAANTQLTDSRGQNPMTSVAIDVTTPAGTGMVRVFAGKSTPTPGTGGGYCPKSSCTTDASGQKVFVDHLADNCIEHTSVAVSRPDGTVVQVLSSSCLSWDGKSNAAGTVVLTDQQAIALATNPALTATMTPSQGAAAAAKYPSLPTFG
ncbi:hypothetical protein P3T37_003935 [Kitasatospora sp. MAA4]|uniref:hypothetical protein n=1 Tax=Kitasatospora sp. MAA4 TaxID=3035093 RepID=UPI00247320F8|nr:hypothetical protein [Kitasatospora sp. MAA4]MDH6134532.1 hypothetical protein [Kitasatospora sp. MAA4]